jgi:hypothetical protein
MYIGCHVKCPLFMSDFNETWIFLTDFRKYSNIKFRGNSSSGRRGVLRWRTDGRIDMTKLTVAFPNFANAPKTRSSILTVSFCVRILQDMKVPNWFQWPRNLRFGSAAARLLGLRIRIPLGEWMSVCLVCVVCCQVEVSASGWSPVQRIPTDCGVSECYREAWMKRRAWPTRCCSAMGEKLRYNWSAC